MLGGCRWGRCAGPHRRRCTCARSIRPKMMVSSSRISVCRMLLKLKAELRSLSDRCMAAEQEEAVGLDGRCCRRAAARFLLLQLLPPDGAAAGARCHRRCCVDV